MKYPIGTKCWIVNARGACASLRGSICTIISHETQGNLCGSCRSDANEVTTDALAPGYSNPATGCCVCHLVPIDDPDAGKSVEEDLAMPIDPRKIGDTV